MTAETPTAREVELLAHVHRLEAECESLRRQLGVVERQRLDAQPTWAPEPTIVPAEVLADLAAREAHTETVAEQVLGLPEARGRRPYLSFPIFSREGK